jgi:hypothetical protein
VTFRGPGGEAQRQSADPQRPPDPSDRGAGPGGADVSLAPYVGHSLHVEVAVHDPRLAHVEALEASIPKQVPPPSPLRGQPCLVDAPAPWGYRLQPSQQREFRFEDGWRVLRSQPFSGYPLSRLASYSASSSALVDSTRRCSSRRHADSDVRDGIPNQARTAHGSRGPSTRSSGVSTVSFFGGSSGTDSDGSPRASALRGVHLHDRRGRHRLVSPETCAARARVEHFGILERRRDAGLVRASAARARPPRPPTRHGRSRHGGRNDLCARRNQTGRRSP